MNELVDKKKRIKRFAEGGDYDVALAQCNELLVSEVTSRAEILRLRAYVYPLQGRYKEAIEDREALIESGEEILRDYYQLADNLLSERRYSDARKWFLETLRLSAEKNETWFDSASWLLLSFAQLRLGQLREAEDSLDKAVAIDPECAMPVRGEGVVTNRHLKAEIQKRRKT